MPGIILRRFQNPKFFFVRFAFKHALVAQLRAQRGPVVQAQQRLIDAVDVFGVGFAPNAPITITAAPTGVVASNSATAQSNASGGFAALLALVGTGAIQITATDNAGHTATCTVRI